MFERALATDPNQEYILYAYAIFLTGDHEDDAPNVYESTLAAYPDHATNLGNCARLLFIVGEDARATELAERALALAGPGEEPLLAECHTYLFMHSPTHRSTSGQTLKTLLAQGVITGNWSFEGNLDRLRKEGDPRLELAEALTRTLRDGDTSRLNTFPEWCDP